MDFKQSIKSVLVVTSILLNMVTMPVNTAEVMHKISMTRANPTQPISRDAILSMVKSKYSGRILSVQEKPKPEFPDCHIVKMLSLDGEYLTIDVACSKD